MRIGIKLIKQREILGNILFIFIYIYFYLFIFIFHQFLSRYYKYIYLE